MILGTKADNNFVSLLKTKGQVYVHVSGRVSGREHAFGHAVAKANKWFEQVDGYLVV